MLYVFCTKFACVPSERSMTKRFEFKLYLQMLSTMRPLPALSISVECRRRTEEIKKNQKKSQTKE